MPLGIVGSSLCTRNSFRGTAGIEFSVEKTFCITGVLPSPDLGAVDEGVRNGARLGGIFEAVAPT